MKLIKTTLILSLLALSPAFSAGKPQQRIPLNGVYSVEFGGHWQTGNVLTPGEPYSISNNSGDTLTVMVLDIDGQTPTQYFLVMQGQTWQFFGGMGLDLYTDQVGQPVHGIELRHVTE